MTLSDLTSLAHKYAAARQKLANILTHLTKAIQRLKDENMPDIKNATTITRHHRDNLAAAIDLNRDLFVKPKTVTVDNIKFGLRKQEGQVTLPDVEDAESKVVALIKKHFPDRVAELIHTVEKPDKDALRKLTVCELGKIGCAYTNDTDQVTIKATDADIEKLVNALLKEQSSDS